jgi:hypothetical protein
MKAITICALCLILCAVPAVAGTIVIGLPAVSGNGFGDPFGLPYSGLFQKVYNSGQFNGAVTIDSLDFYNTEVGHPPTVLDVGQITVSLSTTATDWNTLSANYASNLGPDNTEVFSGIIDESWSFPDTLTIDFSQPFSYNPADGNLLVTVDVLDSPGSGVYFDVNGQFTPNDFMSFAYNGYGVQDGHGLVTGFGTEAPIPEPSSLVLLGSGLLGVVGELRRRFKR